VNPAKPLTRRRWKEEIIKPPAKRFRDRRAAPTSLLSREDRSSKSNIRCKRIEKTNVFFAPRSWGRGPNDSTRDLISNMVRRFFFEVPARPKLEAPAAPRDSRGIQRSVLLLTYLLSPITRQHVGVA